MLILAAAIQRFRDFYDVGLTFLDEERRAKTLRYCYEDDRLHSLCAGLLLHKYVGHTPVSYTHLDVYKRQHTYAELSQDAKAVACYILSLGLKGQNIAILGETSYEYLVAMLGVSASGNVIVPIDCDQATEALYAAISYADAALVIRDAETGELLLGSESIASLPHIALDNLESVTKGVIALGKTRLLYTSEHGYNKRVVR